jgi:Na+/H+-dicarboxylate symporter
MPLGMFSWMCVEAIKMKSPETVLTQLVWFFGTAFLAFFIHLLIILSGIYFLIVRKNPFKFYVNILPAIIVAFGSASRSVYNLSYHTFALCANDFAKIKRFYSSDDCQMYGRK